MHFEVVGPFPIKRFGDKELIEQRSIPDLKMKMEKLSPGLSEACGCYVIAKKAGKGITPWYVGQACAQSILLEAMNSTNREKYNTKIPGKGTMLLYAIPAVTPTTNNFRKKPEAGWLSSFDFLEKWLIAEAIGKNPALINTKETRFLRNLYVPGLFNAQQGDATTSSRLLRKALY